MTDDNIIFSYTADQAIEDGMLVHPYPKRWPNLLITAGIHEKCRDTSGTDFWNSGNPENDGPPAIIW